MRADARSGECLVYTEKEGLLSPVAHDLKIRVTAWSAELDVETRRIVARFDAASLRVDCAMRGGAEDPRALGDKDRREIEKNIRDDVLRCARHPEIVFEAEDAPVPGDLGDTPLELRGRLTLCGHTRDLVLRVSRSGDRIVAEARLHQPDFGIKPYSALFGTLKIKPDVRLVVTTRA
jgi:polyisoprenoid-binding protein YceI